MASSSGSSYASSQETTNFARICRIVVDVLRDILWQVLIHEIPAADLPHRVWMNRNNLTNLDVKIKTWLCGIFPSSPEIPIAEKFDVSSLYTLIRNLCTQVPAPSIQWGKPPPPGRTTLGDDIERIREFRNTLYGHATQAKIDTTNFNNLCIEIRNVVSRFDAYFSSHSTAMKCDFKSAVDTVLTCSMDKSLQDTYIDKMREIGILSDDVENVKQQVGNFVQQVVDVKQQVVNVEQQVSSVEQQVGNVEQQVGDVKQQVVNVEQEVSNVEQQVGDVKQQVVNVEQQVSNVEQQVGNVEQQVGNVEQQVSNVEQQVSNVEQQVGDVKQRVGDVEQKVEAVEQKLGDVEQKVGDVRQHIVNVEQQTGIVNLKIRDVEQQAADVKQHVGDVEHKVGCVEQKVGDVEQQVGNVEQQVGDVERQVSDLETHLKKEIKEIKETFKKNPDVVEKGKIFRDEKDKMEGVDDSLIDEGLSSQSEEKNAGISHQPSQSTKQRKMDKRKKGDRICGFPKRQKLKKTTKLKMTSNADETTTSVAQHSFPKKPKVDEVTESKMLNNADEIMSVLQQRECSSQLNLIQDQKIKV